MQKQAKLVAFVIQSCLPTRVGMFVHQSGTLSQCRPRTDPPGGGAGGAAHASWMIVCEVPPEPEPLHETCRVWHLLPTAD